jgi:ABC-type bacteriocin/lantibiotic exporter with double-glycine peptidase domain
MRMQSSQANCGPTALYNAACALGREVSLEECERACKTTTDGTTVRQLKVGAGRMGLMVEGEVREKNPQIAALLLRDYLNRGCVMLTTVDADEHWVAVVGMLGDRLLVADSAESELVLGYSMGAFLQRWAHPETRKPFFAMVVS